MIPRHCSSSLKNFAGGHCAPRSSPLELAHRGLSPADCGTVLFGEPSGYVCHTSPSLLEPGKGVLSIGAKTRLSGMVGLLIDIPLFRCVFLFRFIFSRQSPGRLLPCSLHCPAFLWRPRHCESLNTSWPDSDSSHYIVLSSFMTQSTRSDAELGGRDRVNIPCGCNTFPFFWVRPPDRVLTAGSISEKSCFSPSPRVFSMFGSLPASMDA